MLTSWLVKRSRRSASGTLCASWTSRGLSHAPAADQFDNLGHDIDELIILLPNLAQQLCFILGNEFQSIEVISELAELPKC